MREGQVTVRAPLGEPRENIQNFIQQKQRWIQGHLKQQKTTLIETQHSFKNGDIFYWLAKPLSLELHASRLAEIKAEGCSLVVRCQSPDNTSSVKRLIERWYKTEGFRWLQSRVQYYGDKLQVQPKGISLRRYKARWGSCARDGSIQFNWLILMAPEAVVDYIVIHELCHLKHFNHSKAFWHLVALIQPDYANHRHWLKTQTQLAWPNNERH